MASNYLRGGFALVPEDEATAGAASVVRSSSNRFSPWAKVVVGALLAAAGLVGLSAARGGQAATSAALPPTATNVNGIIVKQEVPPPGTRLYCFSLMLPFGPEQGLLVQHHQRNIGIFACEGYNVFTNKTIEIVPGVQTYALPGSLAVAYGGKWNLALNTDVFIRVWKAVEYLGSYKAMDWAIKADIDLVFFPDRFRQLVSRTSYEELPGPPIPGGPVFLNNCAYGMHGPLEVLSRDAFATFAANMDVGCKDTYDASMDIFPYGLPEGIDIRDHAYGEDQYIRRCLKELGIPMVNEFDSLLSEKMACTERPQNCGGKVVAFHAYKSEQDWIQCYDYATQYSEWPAVAAPAAAATAAPAPAVAPQASPQQQPMAPQQQPMAPQQQPMAPQQSGYPQTGQPQPAGYPMAQQPGYPQAGYMPPPPQSPLQVAVGRLQGAFR